MNATDEDRRVFSQTSQMPMAHPRSRRVMLVASFAPSLVIFRAHLIRSLVAHGHEVLCLAPEFDAGAAIAVSPDDTAGDAAEVTMAKVISHDDVRARIEAMGAQTAGYPLSRRGLNPLDDLKSLRALRAHMRAFQPDVVMGYTPKAAIYSALAARSTRVPRIVPMITGLGYAFLGHSRKDKAVRVVTSRLYARAFRCSHAAIFHNKDDHEQLARTRVLPLGLPVHVVGGSGVDLSEFGEVALPGLGDGLTFLMIARLLKYKGVEEYCQAARDVRRVAPGARFLLVGPEEQGPGGISAAQLANWNDCVTYLGPRADVRPYLAQCHVFVLPSHDGEGLPRTVLEALATGRPVITTNTRGCRDTVDERVNGCLVPAGDARALADAMLSFLRRPDLIPAMARASRQKALRRFDVERVTKDMLAVMLDETVGQTSSPHAPAHAPTVDSAALILSNRAAGVTSQR